MSGVCSVGDSNVYNHNTGAPGRLPRLASAVTVSPPHDLETVLVQRSRPCPQQYSTDNTAQTPTHFPTTTQHAIRRMESDRVRLRSEAEAPWRSLRLVLYGFSVASAGNN